MKVHAWEVSPPFWESSVFIPYAEGEFCEARHPSAYICTRRPGHSGRHAAACSDGMVCAVWGDVA